MGPGYVLCAFFKGEILTARVLTQPSLSLSLFTKITEKAFEVLRKKGLAAAVKKVRLYRAVSTPNMRIERRTCTHMRLPSLPLFGIIQQSRAAADGLVALARNDKGAVLLELNSETDFVARNDSFRALALKLATAALNSSAVTAAANKGTGFEVPEAILRDLKLDGGKK